MAFASASAATEQGYEIAGPEDMFRCFALVRHETLCGFITRVQFNKFPPAIAGQTNNIPFTTQNLTSSDLGRCVFVADVLSLVGGCLDVLHGPIRPAPMFYFFAPQFAFPDHRTPVK